VVGVRERKKGEVKGRISGGEKQGTYLTWILTETTLLLLQQ